MADEKRAGGKPAARSETPAAKVAAPSPALASAAASSDPAVHQVLADIDIARRNGNDEDVQQLTEQLNDLGYE